ncbi:MAG: alanyl-tRNA editing protein [Acidimicrobiia bacterium]|nr:alanyl-tRNA editing protein [Acidimicrobiia bacterium]
MTDELPATDSYLREVKARVVDHHPEGVVLDRTVFYARGGGQPGDIGILESDAGQFTVEDTYRSKGVVVHRMGDARPPVGTLVEARIDWDRRYHLMRTHTALHALTAIIWKGFGAKATGSNMAPGEARIDFELPSMSVEFGQMVQDQLNVALAQDHVTRIHWMDRAEAVADPDLIRTKVNLIPESISTLRIVDIGDLDRQADGGTHVRSTAEVGAVAVLKTESKGKANKRMRIGIPQ